ncbi:hypothetical protein Tco_0887559 [Tanacetum coccineum]
MKKKSIKKLVEKRVAKAIEEYEKTRVDSSNAGGSGSASTGGIAVVQGCSHKTFMNRKPYSFNRTEGVVGLKRCFVKKSTCLKFASVLKEDKICFAASTFEVRLLTWWNGNVQTLGLANANQIPWRDDIEAYTNRFHELVLMCPELVSTENKKIEKYIRGFPERIKGKITSPKLQPGMMPSTWPVNWSNNQFRVGLQELVRAIRGNGKTTKETPTTITPATTTTTTIIATETTTITSNRTRDT